MIKNKGFTLIELAVLIVIIGVIITAIASGRDLVKQSQLRSVMTDFQQHKAAYKLFVQTYGKAPGDFEKGSLYWPNGPFSCASGSGVCNGNGDGMISYSLVGGLSGLGGLNENAIALRQLKMAQMIDFSSTVLTDSTFNGSTSGTRLIAGVNAPRSKISGAGYFFSGYEMVDRTYVLQNCGDTTSPWTGEFVNSVYIGRASDQVNGDERGGLSYGAVSPADAFTIDSKMDDGKVENNIFLGRNTGQIRVFRSCNPGPSNCFNPADQSYYANVTSHPNLEGCILGFQVDD